jgi:tubulin---tyrosine ligase
MEFTNHFKRLEHAKANSLSITSETNNSTICNIPNHFPTLKKAGFSEWLPKKFRIPLKKIIEGSMRGTINSSTQPIYKNEDPAKKIVTPKLVSNPITPESLGPTHLKAKETEKMKKKRQMIKLFEELELTIRKIPSFQIKGIPTPTHNKYELMKTISPLKICVEMPQISHKRTYTGNIITKKNDRIMPEALEKEKINNKQWIFLYFLESIRNSNGVHPQMKDSKSFKFYVGQGNNSGLVVRLLRSRPWWVQTDNKKEANLIWTSLKHQKTIKKLQKGLGFKLKKSANIKLPRKKALDAEKLGYNLILDSKDYVKLETASILDNYSKICNRVEENENICSKKFLYINLKNYFENINKKTFDFIPLTFHVKSLVNDIGFIEFQDYYNRVLSTDDKNIWIIKPGEDTNRGKGISVSCSFEEIKQIVSEKSESRTYIIQKYIDRPLLINKRKFDIRCFGLISCINSNIQGYFYKEGYIRTSSKEFSIKNLDNKYIHLTNDAIQKNSDDYGKFEPANKMSYLDLQHYIDVAYPDSGINFERDIHKQIKEIVIHSIKAVFSLIDPYKRLHSFELFGYDFMIDEGFKVWLIEVNTNPCLETSCAFLSRIIPACLDNTFRLVLDPLFPPPYEKKKLNSWLEDVNISNKFELVFNEYKETDNLT